MVRPERPIYCGNYEYDMLEGEIRRLFDEYGPVDRVDMKTFCFVYMADERDAERAIRKLDGREVGRRHRPLRCQWAKSKDADRPRQVQPSSTLFVVNFDVARTRESDLERHFEAYGNLKRVEIKKSYAFVQYETVQDAEYAMRKTHLSNILGRTITVEYVVNEDPNAARERGQRERDEGGGRGRDRDDYHRRDDRSPVRRDRSRSRSRSRDRGRSYSR